MRYKQPIFAAAILAALTASAITATKEYVDRKDGEIAALSTNIVTSATNAVLDAARGYTDTAISQLPAWAKAESKPTYTASEISVANVWGETVQQFASNIDSFLGSLPSPSDMLIKMYDGRIATYSGGQYYPVEELHIGDHKAATVADIPDVPAWALEAQKPTYTAAEVGATSPAAVSNIVSTAYVHKKLGAWMEYDEATGLYYYCHEEE